jgi:hypothetical protein
MALVVEDGSDVPNANSYVSDGDLTAYAATIGATLPSDGAAREILLVKAMRYIEARASRYRGNRTYTDQALSWPRNYVWLDDTGCFSNTAIPAQLKTAQMELAIAAQTIDFYPLIQANVAGALTDKKIGPLEFKYDSSIAANPLPTIPYVDQLLSQLYAAGNGVRAVRG